MASACAETRLETLRGKALVLFAERGFAQVGMRELALHLGMAAGSLYHHFESKEQLLFELIEELYEELLGAPPALFTCSPVTTLNFWTPWYLSSAASAGA